ncbi:hypothetical protein LTR37_006171 [Vermiconidia calcicola]|uniref:Uncharacterized protein n=1 Tax=Vermiconidia calcicola TaxID=1690605 RepID=A0ACC3NIC0_9PEZI|nr:hypothetical protein LTR37_006171 [Vermiconidia calcicola]
MTEIVAHPRCYLLEIPPELRLRIYGYVYEERCKCWLVEGDKWKLEGEDRRGPEQAQQLLALMKTCRLINSEATHALYNSVEFIFTIGHAGYSLWEFAASRSLKASMMHVVFKLEPSNYVAEAVGYFCKLLEGNRAMKTCLANRTMAEMKRIIGMEAHARSSGLKALRYLDSGRA